jgi:hypothetical protein
MGDKEKLDPFVGVLSAAKTEAAHGRSRTRRRRERLLPLHPLLPRRRAAASLFFLLASELHHHTAPTPALRPVATKVRRQLPSSCGCPAIEPRWDAPMLHAAAPLLVMPAFVPGWDEACCRSRCLRQRAPRSWPRLPVSSLFVVNCHSRPRRRAEPIAFAFALVFECVASLTRRPASPCTPARARVDPGGPG